MKSILVAISIVVSLSVGYAGEDWTINKVEFDKLVASFKDNEPVPPQSVPDRLIFNCKYNYLRHIVEKTTPGYQKYEGTIISGFNDVEAVVYGSKMSIGPVRVKYLTDHNKPLPQEEMGQWGIVIKAYSNEFKIPMDCSEIIKYEGLTLGKVCTDLIERRIGAYDKNSSGEKVHELYRYTIK